MPMIPPGSGSVKLTPLLLAALAPADYSYPTLLCLNALCYERKSSFAPFLSSKLFLMVGFVLQAVTQNACVEGIFGFV